MIDTIQYNTVLTKIKSKKIKKLLTNHKNWNKIKTKLGMIPNFEEKIDEQLFQTKGVNPR